MARDERILVLGGSHSELPLIQAAKRLGLFVVTSGNQPEHPGHLISDLYLKGDFSDLSQMEDVLARSGCRHVVAAANDFAYLTACQLAERHRLPGFDPSATAFALHHKHLFKPVAAGLGMPVTRFKVVQIDSPPDWTSLGLNYPLIVKPVDLTGGKGMTIVRKPVELSNAISYAAGLSRKKELVIEEFFEGSLHSYSTILANGSVVFEYADNEFCHPNPFLVSTSTSLVSVPAHILADLRLQTEKLARHLHLCDGVLHAQFLYMAGDYRILEYTRRCSGDLYSVVVEHVTGLRHADQFVRQSLGLSTELAWVPARHNLVSRHCVFAKGPEANDGFIIDSALRPYVESMVRAWPVTHQYRQVQAEKAAVALLHYPTLEAMARFTPRLHELIHGS